MERRGCTLRPRGREAVVKLLLEAKADVNVKEIEDGPTALHFAAHNGHEAVVKLHTHKVHAREVHARDIHAHEVS